MIAWVIQKTLNGMFVSKDEHSYTDNLYKACLYKTRQVARDAKRDWNEYSSENERVRKVNVNITLV